MSRMSRHFLSMSLCASCVLLTMTSSTFAVINAGLQPVDLYERYNNVFAGQIAAINPAKHVFTLRVNQSFKGTYTAGQEIAVQAAETQHQAFTRRQGDGELVNGAEVAVLLGGKGRRSQKKVLLYFGKWFCIGEITSTNVIDWQRGDDEAVGIDGAKIPTMAGTWFGSTLQLIRMFKDIQEGRSFFPRKAYARFKEDILLDSFGGTPVRGVGLHDIDRDGDLDVYACCEEGDRIYLQMEPMVFVNATDWMGLDSASTSCSFADVNGDGLVDLLTDAEIRFGQRFENRFWFEYEEVIPRDVVSKVKSSAFVELNGDGYPDILMTMQEGGLKAFLNPGNSGGAFSNATATMGLATAACGAKDVGFFAVGDWNDDCHTDIFFAAGPGRLLINRDGQYAPLSHSIKFNFTSGEDEALGLTGAGCFAPIINTGTLDLVVPIESSWHVIENRARTPIDVTEYGNEISEGSYLHLATLAEDLNLDGHVDLYTVSRQKEGQNRFIINRGYGSFMLASAHKYHPSMFNGPIHKHGGWGVAAGDVNGDGAPDLLIGNLRGELALILNETLELRTEQAHPTAEIAQLLKTTVVNVTVQGNKGVVGASVRVKDTKGEIVARRDIGTNIGAGSCGPHVATFAIRNPGEHKVTVKYADGHMSTRAIDLGGQRRVKMEIDRDTGR
ncbi:FG-GAP repeat domain-containing protein [Planctomycetota bacterium]